MVITPNIDIVKKGVIIRFATKLGSELSEVLAWRNLSGSSTLLIATTRVVGIPQMVFTNPIMVIHGNKTINWPLRNSIVVGAYRSVDFVHPRWGYREPFIITVPTLDHRDCHYVRPNRVALKYLNFKKIVDLDVHVRVFNSIVKTSAKTFEKYIINTFNYTLRNMASN